MDKFSSQIKITTSAGGLAIYRFATTKHSYYLLSVYNPQRPFIQYKYTPSDKEKEYSLLTERKVAGKLSKQIAYYKKGDNDLDGMQEFIKERADKRIDRVKMLKAPVGEDSTPIVTHRFKYTIYDKDTQDANGKKIEAGAGVTDVYLKNTGTAMIIGTC